METTTKIRRKRMSRELTESLVTSFRKKGKRKQKGLMIVSEPSMGVSYRKVDQFPDPYAEFEPKGFELIDFLARINRRIKMTEVFSIPELGINRNPHRYEDYMTGNFRFTENASGETFKKLQLVLENFIQHPNRKKIYNVVMNWLLFRHKETGNELLFVFENHFSPHRFICRGINGRPVEKEDIKYIYNLSPGFFNYCNFNKKKLVVEDVVCIPE